MEFSHTDRRHCSWTKCHGHTKVQAVCTLQWGGQRLQFIRHFFFYVQGLPQVIINLPNQKQPCVCGIMSW